MKLPFMKKNLKITLEFAKLDDLLISLKEISDRWVIGIWTFTKAIASLFGLVALMSGIVVSTVWFIDEYGAGTFLLVLLLTSFMADVLGNVSIKSDD